MTITVPTHTYLKKFLLHRANCQEGIINISSTTSYGIHLIKILQKKAQWEPRESLKDFHDHVEFHLSEFFYTRLGFHFSKQNILFFNQTIKSEFDDHIYDMITLNISREYKTTIEREIQIVLKYYGITEVDRSMETMIKAYQRWRKERNYMVIRL